MFVSRTPRRGVLITNRGPEDTTPSSSETSILGQVTSRPTTAQECYMQCEAWRRKIISSAIRWLTVGFATADAYGAVITVGNPIEAGIAAGGVLLATSAEAVTGRAEQAIKAAGRHALGMMLRNKPDGAGISSQTMPPQIATTPPVTLYGPAEGLNTDA